MFIFTGIRTNEVSGNIRVDENVSVIDVEHECAELDGTDANDYEIVRYEYVYKFASRPGGKVVLQKIRSEKPYTTQKSGSRVAGVSEGCLVRRTGYE